MINIPTKTALISMSPTTTARPYARYISYIKMPIPIDM